MSWLAFPATPLIEECSVLVQPAEGRAVQRWCPLPVMEENPGAAHADVHLERTAQVGRQSLWRGLGA